MVTICYYSFYETKAYYTQTPLFLFLFFFNFSSWLKKKATLYFTPRNLQYSDHTHSSLFCIHYGQSGTTKIEAMQTKDAKKN